MPGSTGLADAVVRTMATHNLAILANHGQVAVAADFPHVLQNARFFELACQLILTLGRQIQPLPAEAVRQLRQGGAA